MSLNMLECKAITSPYFGWLDELRRGLEHDLWVKSKSQEVAHSITDSSQGTNSKLSTFHIDNGFLKYKGRIVLRPTSSWKSKILEEHHCTPTSGHQGAQNLSNAQKALLLVGNEPKY